jgi:hypothetical protein
VSKRDKPHPDCPVCRYWQDRLAEARARALKGDADSRRTELKAKSELDDHLARTANLVLIPVQMETLDTTIVQEDLPIDGSNDDIQNTGILLASNDGMKQVFDNAPNNGLVSNAAMILMNPGQANQIQRAMYYVALQVCIFNVEFSQSVLSYLPGEAGGYVSSYVSTTNQAEQAGLNYCMNTYLARVQPNSPLIKP